MRSLSELTNRRTATAVFTVAVLGLTLTSCGGDDKESVSTKPSAPATVAKLDCPTALTLIPQDPPVADKQDGALVPTGAVAARMCRAGFPQPGAPAPQPSGGPVMKTDVDKIVTALNALPAKQTKQACTMDAAAPARLILAYPDGREVSVDLDLGGCGKALSGDQLRHDAKPIGQLLK